MPQPEEVTKTISVPENTGVPGFLRTIEEILKLSSVQRITIEANGDVTYKRYVIPGEEAKKQNLNLDLSDLQPHHIIRNAEVREITYATGTPAPAVIGAMLDLMATQRYTPIAFATGADTRLYSWYNLSSGQPLRSRDALFGYALYFDKALPDTTLVLCAGYGRTQSLIDTRFSLKVEIPMSRVLDQEIEVS